MSGFTRLLENAAGHVRGSLHDEGVPEADTDVLVDLLERANLPALLALAANGTRTAGDRPATGAPLVAALAKTAAARPELSGHGVDEATVARVLTTVLVERRSPATLLHDPVVRDALLDAAVRALERETGMKLSPGDRRAAIELLSSGQLFRDVATATAVVIHAVPGVPVALVRDVRHLPHRLVLLGAAIARDVVDTPLSVPSVAADLLADGDLDRQPTVMRHTLRALFDAASVRSTADTLASLLRIRAVRLAIVAYARTNGIPLEEDDLDTLRTSVLEAEHPDLGPLLSVALTRLVERHGGGDATRLLGRLGST